MSCMSCPVTRPAYEDTLSVALTRWVSGHIGRAGTIPVLMVSGAQGIGKTTALTAMARAADYRVAILSLDDFYLGRDDRLQLAASVHPLFETRGPPGTHDLVLLNHTLDTLLQAGSGTHSLIPRFDKSQDTRVPRAQWPVFIGRPDAVLVEGWLMGVDASPEASAMPPLNTVEEADPNGVWRAFQEACLRDDYAALWNRADAFFHIDAPGFNAVLGWRLEQEASNLGIPLAGLPNERRKWVADFILYFERLTRRMLSGQRRPGHALPVDTCRNPIDMSGTDGGT